MAENELIMEPDGEGSFKFTFVSDRRELAGRVGMGVEGPPDRRSKEDNERCGRHRRPASENLQGRKTAGERAPIVPRATPFWAACRERRKSWRSPIYGAMATGVPAWVPFPAMKRPSPRQPPQIPTDIGDYPRLPQEWA
jgi:hypothetical protein